MSKEYAIHSEEDFDEMVINFQIYFKAEKMKGSKFRSLKIIAKRFVKSKTPPQHRAYFACINELKKAFEEVGYRFTQDQLHYLMKKESGFTKMVELPNGKQQMIIRSISDISDVSCEAMGHLIEFVIEYAALNLNYVIKIEDYS